MRLPSLNARALAIACLIGVGIAFDPAAAQAVGEEINDIRVLGNQRTDEATIRSIAGLAIGDTLEADTLDTVRERLNTRGLFSDVNVWWEAHGDGVRVNISVKDKFPWAPVPTASWSANNKAFGLVFVHGNLFGRGKQLLVAGRIATIDSGAAVAYRDPSLFGTWMYWQLQAFVQQQTIPEYLTDSLATPTETRETHLFSYGLEPTIGIAWMRRLKTQVGWHIEKFTLDPGSDEPLDKTVPLIDATEPGTIGVGRATMSLDFRAREFAVMTGAALSASIDYASPAFGSSFKYWRAGASWEQGFKIFRSHNFIYSVGANTGHNLPFFVENTAGGPNLRGYLVQQFRGDTQMAGKAEYHFPLFSIGALDFRALGFYDVVAIGFHEAPPTTVVGPDASGQTYLQRDVNLRTFPQGPNGQYGVPFGFHLGGQDSSVHNAVGGGLRFFLRSVAVPLIGFDAGYGIEARHWQFMLIVGA